jgi:cell wall-associated NlpC family hydrolase
MNKYAVTDVEKEWIDAFLSADAQEYWDMLGLDLGDGDMFTGDVDIIISNLPTGTLGSVIVQAAFTRLGDPYSMSLRGQGRYVDCSYLTQWAYAQAGVSIPGTAAEQAQYCVENNKVIDPSAAQPGDLIFWSYPNNSRVSGLFMAIGHVAIYVSDGMMIEAAPSAGGVTYRAVSVQGTPAFYARPYV